MRLLWQKNSRYANSCHSGVHGYPPGHSRQMSKWAIVQACRQAFPQAANIIGQGIMQKKGQPFSVPSTIHHSYSVLCILIYECIPHPMANFLCIHGKCGRLTSLFRPTSTIFGRTLPTAALSKKRRDTKCIRWHLRYGPMSVALPSSALGLYATQSHGFHDSN